MHKDGSPEYVWVTVRPTGAAEGDRSAEKAIKIAQLAMYVLPAPGVFLPSYQCKAVFM